jgi:hypothetical protein
MRASALSTTSSASSLYTSDRSRPNSLQGDRQRARFHCQAPQQQLVLPPPPRHGQLVHLRTGPGPTHCNRQEADLFGQAPQQQSPPQTWPARTPPDRSRPNSLQQARGRLIWSGTAAAVGPPTWPARTPPTGQGPTHCNRQHTRFVVVLVRHRSSSTRWIAYLARQAVDMTQDVCQEQLEHACCRAAQHVNPQIHTHCRSGSSNDRQHS